LPKALSSIKAKAIVMPVSTDLYFPPEDNAIEVQHMPNAELRAIDIYWGHFAGGPGTSRDDITVLDAALKELQARRAGEGRPLSREDLYGAVMAGAVERVRPKMMTVAAIMAGLLPIMWSHGTGAEVMQRIAVPMIGGMVSSTVLTLIVIPAIYAVIKGVAIRIPAVVPSRQRT